MSQQPLFLLVLALVFFMLHPTVPILLIHFHRLPISILQFIQLHQRLHHLAVSLMIRQQILVLMIPQH